MMPSSPNQFNTEAEGLKRGPFLSEKSSLASKITLHNPVKTGLTGSWERPPPHADGFFSELITSITSVSLIAGQGRADFPGSLKMF